MGKWSYEQRVNEKNAKFYYIQTAELQNYQTKEKGEI